MHRKYQGWALITGGSGGFGFEFARQLGNLGYDLVLVARNQAKLESAKQILIKEFDINVITISQDLSQSDASHNICDLLLKHNITIGLLINNVGEAAFNRFHEIPLDTSLSLVNLMCAGVTELTHRLLPAMLERKSGGIIFVASIAACFPGPFNAIYSACKAFEVQLAISLHAEYKKSGVDILAICPGSAKTEIFKKSGLPFPRDVKPLSVTSVVRESLASLGNDIVLNFPNDRATGIAIFLSRILPYRIRERGILSAMKRMWGFE